MCVWCSAGSRSGSPGRVLTTTALSTVSSGVQRVLVNSASAQKRSKIPRSQGCSREASPSRLSVGKAVSPDVGPCVSFVPQASAALRASLRSSEFEENSFTFKENWNTGLKMKLDILSWKYYFYFKSIFFFAAVEFQ